MEWPAWAVLGFWFASQFFIGVQQVDGGVAWMAHVGGFVFGVIAIYILGGRPQRPQPLWSQHWRYQQR
jgi:membrane associated rhomboid family serine protease